MALTRPTLLNVVPFDATKAYVFSFTSTGGSTNITSNRLTVQRNDTLEIVYNEQQTTFSYQHNLPADTLTNGVTYQATIQTYGADGSQSVPSVPIIFRCLETPTFEFTNIPTANTITANSYQFNLTYNQANGELLNSVVFNLYSASGALVSTSGNLTNFDTIPANVTYLFSGFENNGEYSIQANGQTVSGMSISTSLVDLFVRYSDDSVYSDLIVTNNCNGGYITIQSSIVAILGKSNPSPPLYVENRAVYLLKDGTWVKFDSGYELTGDFTAKLWTWHMNPNSEVFRMSTVDGAIVKLRNENDGENFYITLSVIQNGLTYYAVSNPIPLESAWHEIYVMLRRVNNLYQIQIEDKGAVAK